MTFPSRKIYSVVENHSRILQGIKFMEQFHAFCSCLLICCQLIRLMHSAQNYIDASYVIKIILTVWIMFSAIVAIFLVHISNFIMIITEAKYCFPMFMHVYLDVLNSIQFHIWIVAKRETWSEYEGYENWIWYCRYT